MTKNYFSLIVAAILCPLLGGAQNIVINPSFEAYNACPPTLSGIAYSPAYSFFPTAFSWVSPLQNTSPDYFNACAPGSTNASVPTNIFGSKLTHSGNAYAGIIAWEGQYNGSTLINDYREYIETRLSQPMVTGKKYCITFYVSSALGPNFVDNFVAIDEIGASFSQSQVSVATGSNLALLYDVKNPGGNFLNDTSKWYRIRGMYTSVGGEQWMTIGCFHSGGLPSYQQVHPQTPVIGNKRIYLYIDDVSVIQTSSSDTIYSSRDTSFCTYHNLNCMVSGVGNGDEYLWNTGGTSMNEVVQDTGTYWCRTVRDCNVYYDTIHVRYRPPLPLSLGSDSVNCHNQPITLQPTSNYQSYNWSTGATSPSIVVTQSGYYTVTVKDACGVQQKSIKVTIQPATPAPVVSDTAVCQYAQNIQLTGIGTNLTWYNYLSDIFGFPTQPLIITDQPGVRILYVSQTSGACESERVPIKLTVKYQPQADIGDHYKLCQRDTIRIGKEYPDVKYLWSSGEDVCCIHPERSGNFTFSIYNDCGISTDSVHVELMECNECLLIPNAFSPNNDGKNDLYKMVTICPVTHYQLRIFNRWGAEVFASGHPEEGWDGTVNSVTVEPGVFVFMMEYEAADTGMKYHKKGNITVIR